MTELEAAAERVRVAQYDDDRAGAETARLSAAYDAAITMSHAAAVELRAAQKALFEVAAGKVNA